MKTGLHEHLIEQNCIYFEISFHVAYDTYLSFQVGIDMLLDLNIYW